MTENSDPRSIRADVRRNVVAGIRALSAPQRDLTMEELLDARDAAGGWEGIYASRRDAEAANAAAFAKQATEAEDRMQRGFRDGVPGDRIRGLRDSIRAKTSQLALLRDQADEQERRAAGLTS